MCTNDLGCIFACRVCSYSNEHLQCLDQLVGIEWLKISLWLPFFLKKRMFYFMHRHLLNALLSFYLGVPNTCHQIHMQWFEGHCFYLLHSMQWCIVVKLTYWLTNSWLYRLCRNHLSCDLCFLSFILFKTFSESHKQYNFSMYQGSNLFFNF